MMKNVKNQQQLKLVLLDSSVELIITEFDGCGGKLVSHHSEGMYKGKISTDDGRLLWIGPIEVLEGSRFNLCVCPSSIDSKDEVIHWKDLPPFFTVFDGGYGPLSQEDVGALLDDLVTFYQLVKVRCHFELDGKQHTVAGKWGDQENLKQLSEILIDWNFPEILTEGQIVLLEMELFETVYFAIGIIAESDQNGLIAGLTAHFYRQKNRIGRRIPIEPLEIGPLKIMEVSDFGLKVIAPCSAFVSEAIISIPFQGTKISFEVTYRKNISPEHEQIGLMIADHSAAARRAWQSFLLTHQYPLLKYRTKEDHDTCWELLEKSGYLNNMVVGTMVKDAKKDVYEEWAFTDREGPDAALTVLGIPENSQQAVATIGIARASANVWVAQAAAAINDPKYLSYTESMYSWRTRAILQQNDGDFHLAFFDADKPFLDRFFRKFYLKCGKNSDGQSMIDWTEWYAHYLKNNFIPSTEQRQEAIQEGSDPTDGKFPKVLLQGSHPFSVKVEQKKFGFQIVARKHLHVAQLLTSIWNTSDTYQGYVSEVKSFFDNGHKFVLIMNKQNFDPELEGKQGAYKYNKTVVWICPRVLLPDFLQNSLKALEIMNRKYGAKRVA